MTRQIPNFVKRIVPLMLAIMLVASAMFVPSVVSAATKEEYEALGLHKTTEFNFADGDISAITEDFATVSVPEGEEYLYIGKPAKVGKSLRFDAYGDIESYSFDIKLDSFTASTAYTPAIVFYDETYTTTDSRTKNAVSIFDFSYASGTWKMRTKGLYTGMVNQATLTFPEGVDWTQDWLTLTMNYSTDYADYTSRTDRKDPDGDAINCKYLTSIVLSAGETNIMTQTFTPSGHYACARVTYGVNASLTENTDNEVVSLGFNYDSSNAVGVCIDNIKVTYRDNAPKVAGYIDDIGDVVADAACLAKIEKAEAAYDLLTDTEKAKVANYATLTAARVTYTELIENADIAAVAEKIDEIGAVDASDACLAKIIAAEEAYAALAPEKQAKVANYATLVKARSAYNAAKYGIHADETIDFTDYTDASTVATDGIKANELVIPAAKNKDIYYQVYGDIKTFSYDIYLDGDATASQIDFPKMHYYDGDGMYLSLQTKSDGTKQLKFNNAWQVIKSGVDFADFVDKTLNITLEYSTKEELYNRINENDAVGKYIKKITITDKATNGELITFEPNSNYHKYLWKYGVNYYDATAAANDMTKADPDVVTIGFGTPGNNNVPVTISNLKIGYYNTAIKEKINAINDIVIDNSATTVAQIADIKGTYSVLPEEMKSAELTAKINAAAAAIEVAVDAEAPVVKGATIHATDDIANQNTRFSTVMPTQAPAGYSIVEYGTVMFPTQLIDEGEELKLGIVDGDNKAGVGKTTVEEGAAIPLAWDSVLIGIDFKADANNSCGIRISARSYVKYSDGENEIIVYSKNTDNYEEAKPTQGINKGVCNRSVYTIAKNIAAAVVDTATYPVDSCGEIVGEIDLATAGNAEILTFVYNNQARVAAIAAAKAAN
ncbi:MAG: hypothetical protein IJP22_04080 [Clostridia bacterium]|nr:hypothetical protein [Clostridia bacterium]